MSRSKYDLAGVLTIGPLYAVDITRLPAVDTNHCDISAILAEMQHLRAEVRIVGQLTEELRQLRAELESVRDQCAKLQADKEAFPPLAATATTSISQPTTNSQDRSTMPVRPRLFADIMQKK